MSENKDKLNSLFNALGFGLPEDSEELSSFENFNRKFTFLGNENKIDPDKITNFLNKDDHRITNVDYHKRTVLAAEIVFQLKDEPTLGHLKLQKLLYFCQNAMKLQIHANFLKQAMGPYDPKLMRSLDSQFEKNRWFRFQRNDFPKYLALENAGGHLTWYNRYYQNSAAQVDFIINTFRKIDTRKVELIATIFACWLEIQSNAALAVSDEMLIENVYAWSKEKAKFNKPEIQDSIQWMKDNGFSPI